MNGIADEMIEAAAKALYGQVAPHGDPEWDDARVRDQDVFRQHAKVALDAALAGRTVVELPADHEHVQASRSSRGFNRLPALPTTNPCGEVRRPLMTRRGYLRKALVVTVLIAMATLSTGCKGCPEGKKLFVWQVNGVTYTQCR